MAENTDIGPADDNDVDGLPGVTSHVTFGKKDENQTDGFTGGSTEGNDSVKQSGSLEPTQYPY